MKKMGVLLLILVLFAWTGQGSLAQGTSDAALDELRSIAKEERRLAEVAARDLLGQVVETPIPPGISLACHHETEHLDEEILDHFLDDFSQPELDVLGNLLEAARRVELTTGALPDSDFTLEHRVLRRLLQKVDTLIGQYYGEEDYYVAVSRAALTTERNYQLLGGEEGHTYLPRLAAWAEQLARKYLQDLKENHQYRNIHPIVKIAREAALLGSNIEQDFYEELQAALSFQVETTVKINEGLDWGLNFDLRGEGFLNLSETWDLTSFQGEGKGSYEHYQHNGVDGIETTSVMNNISDIFRIQFAVANFNPCQSETFDVYLDRFGSENESITITSDEGSVTQVGPVVQSMCAYSFRTHQEGKLFRFTVQLQNGNRTVGEETFSRRSERGIAEFSIKLTHGGR